MAEEKIIQEQLMKLLETYYNGSFPQMVCEYIRTTGMTQEEVEELLEAMKDLRRLCSGHLVPVPYDRYERYHVSAPRGTNRPL